MEQLKHYTLKTEWEKKLRNLSKNIHQKLNNKKQEFKDENREMESERKC